MGNTHSCGYHNWSLCAGPALSKSSNLKLARSIIDTAKTIDPGLLFIISAVLLVMLLLEIFNIILAQRRRRRRFEDGAA